MSLILLELSQVAGDTVLVPGDFNPVSLNGTSTWKILKYGKYSLAISGKKNKRTVVLFLFWRSHHSNQDMKQNSLLSASL